MNVGRIGRVNSLYSVNRANSINPAGLMSATNRVNEVRKVGDVLASPEREIRQSDDYLASVFRNSDGDLAEISNKARELWRNLSGGAAESPALQHSQEPTIGLPFDYQFDLPSPFPDWNQLIVNTDAPPVTNERVPVNTPTPDVAAPILAPVDAAAPDKTNPEAGLPGTDTYSFEVNPLKPAGECKTCESRRYIDKSDDPSVSFQTPTKISPNMAASAVASHENEHVSHEKGKARRDNREIVNQTVTFTYDVCPECGRNFVSGGTTHTTSVSKPETGDKSNTGDDGSNGSQ